MNANRLGSYPMNEVLTGDSRQLARSIPDQSVDLIFTDPIYQNQDDYLWLAEISKRILKPKGSLLCWSNGKWHRANANWLESAGMVYRWDFACVHNSGLSPMNGKIIAKTNRLIWLDVSGKSKLVSYIADGFLSTPWLSNSQIEKRKEHRWTKSPKFTKIAIEAFSLPNAIVYDPFAGGGTNLAICKMYERNFIASEIDPKTATIARSRLSRTNPPLGLAASNTASSRLFEGWGKLPAVSNSIDVESPE